MKFLKVLFLIVVIQVSSYGQDFTITIDTCGIQDVMGVYTFTGYENNRPVFENSSCKIEYSLIGCFPKWRITRQTEGLFKNSDENIFPPQNDWELSCPGVEPVPSLKYNFGYLSYSKNTFNEDTSNQGHISNNPPMIVQLINNDSITFSGSIGEDFYQSSKFTINNLPNNLTPQAIKLDDSTLEVTISGQAIYHDDTNSVSNLQIAFNDNALSNNDISSVFVPNGSYINILFRKNIGINENKLPKPKFYRQGTKIKIENKLNNDIELYLFSFDGKVIKKHKGASIDIATLDQGIYLLKVKCNNQIYIEKIFIQN